MAACHDGRSFRQEWFFVQKCALRKLDVFYSFKIILNFFEVCWCFSKICFKEKFHYTLLICVGIRFSWMKDLKYFWNVLTWMAAKIYDSSRCDYTFFSARRNGCDGRCMFINIKASKKFFHYRRWLANSQRKEWIKRSFLPCAKNSSLRIHFLLFNRFYVWSANSMKKQNITNWHKWVTSNHCKDEIRDLPHEV